MPFGLFKKKSFADAAFFCKALVSEDPETRGQRALAVKDGRISAIGDEDYVRSLCGPETEIHELGELYLSAGFSAPFSQLAGELFKDG